jgi:uncharacterized protein YqjF (DUF2071 family)
VNTEITDIKDLEGVRPVALRREFTAARSDAARERMQAGRGERLFVAGWTHALMVHFEVPAAALQRAVPFPLDLWRGRAFVSLVAFTMRGMRPVIGGRMGALLFRPLATHDFLNVRTYVRHHGEPGIHFIAEWLNNRLAAALGPVAFGLPYRHGQIEYQNDWRRDGLRGQVADVRTGGKLIYWGRLPEPEVFQPCQIGSLDEWLMERYIAFNSAGGCRRSFRVWHPPWPQCPAEVAIREKSLLTRNWPWFDQARLIGANYSPGFHEVWMGRPHFCPGSNHPARRFRHGAFFDEPG